MKTLSTILLCLTFLTIPVNSRKVQKLLKAKNDPTYISQRELQDKERNSTESAEKTKQTLDEIRAKRTFDENDSDEDHFFKIASRLKDSKKETKNPLFILNKKENKTNSTLNLRTKNQSYMDFKRRHESDMDLAKISINSFQKRKANMTSMSVSFTQDEEKEENLDRCDSDFKMTFFKDIDFQSENFKLTDSTIEKYCPYLRQTCCSGAEINKRFENLSKRFDSILIDLHEIFSFFKYMTNLTDEEIHIFTKKNHNKINKCLLNDPVELDTVLLEFKSNSKVFYMQYINYIKKRFIDSYSLQCGVCDFKNSDYFSANILNSKYTIQLDYEELFDFIEGIYLNEKVFDIFNFASFLECFTFENKTPVNFMPDPALYKMLPFLQKKSFIVSASKKTKTNKLDQQNLVVPTSIIDYISRHHPVMGFKVIEWGKMRQTLQALFDKKSTKNFTYNNVMQHIEIFQPVNNQLPRVKPETVDIEIENKGYSRLENGLNNRNKYIRNDLGDLKTIVVYNRVWIVGCFVGLIFGTLF